MTVTEEGIERTLNDKVCADGALIRTALNVLEVYDRNHQTRTSISLVYQSQTHYSLLCRTGPQIYTDMSLFSV